MAIRMFRLTTSLGALALAGCAGVSGSDHDVSPPGVPPAPPAGVGQTRVLDQLGAARLRANKGITLQWIDWNTRGSVSVESAGPVWHLRGAQAAAGSGRLLVDGDVTEIGPDYFVLVGTIRITDTPDPGRTCEKRATWRFAITQNRPYYRMRTFEWCDGLTDYIDIYF